MSQLVGRTIGPYRVIEQVGKGGMAVVYKAYQPSMDRYVAIKVLSRQLSQDGRFFQRFQREAKAIAKLEHSHILPAHDYGEHDGDLYIVMRYVEAGSLQDRISKGLLSLAEIYRIVAQIGGALDYAHGKGVIHRDIKPSNILMDAQGDAFLADFGLVRMIAASAQFTTSGVIGTPAYMSPEQAKGITVDHRSDVYSLGIVLYEMVTGRVPFEADTPYGLILQHVQEPVPPPRTLVPGVPDALEQVILKALAKEPDQRYQSAAEMVEAVALTTQVGSSPELFALPRAEQLGQAPTQAQDTPTLTPTDQLPPFIAGPPITHPARFFGRERELRRIFHLLKRLPLQNAAIVGPARSGKTSLLHYLRTILLAAPGHLRPGQRADWLPQPERYQWIFVDFQDPRLGSQEELLSYLLDHLGLSALRPISLERFLDAVSDDLCTPTVILFDEIGVALERYPELDDAFWESLRSLATNQVGGNLAFVLASHDMPDQLAQQSGLGSPFFNIFGYVATLGPLSEQAARELIASSPILFPSGDVEWILEQSGRWPLLLQILCRERLITLEEGEIDEIWREDGLRQIAPFRHLLAS